MRSRIDIMASSFQDELQKIAQVKYAGAVPDKKTVGKALPMVGAVVGWEALRRANQDRKTGRMMRQQQSF